MKENVDWQMLKSEYAEGSLSLTVLAEKFNLSYYVLVRLAGMERWREARQRFRNACRRDYRSRQPVRRGLFLYDMQELRHQTRHRVRSLRYQGSPG